MKKYYRFGVMAFIMAMLMLPGFALADQAQGQAQGQTAVNYGSNPVANASSTASANPTQNNTNDQKMSFDSHDKFETKSIAAAPVYQSQAQLPSGFLDVDDSHNFNNLNPTLRFKKVWTRSELKNMLGEGEVELDGVALDGKTWEVNTITLVTELAEGDEGLFRGPVDGFAKNNKANSKQVLAAVCLRAMDMGADTLLVYTHNRSRAVKANSGSIGLGYSSWHVGGNDLGGAGGGLAYGWGEVTIQNRPFIHAESTYRGNGKKSASVIPEPAKEELKQASPEAKKWEGLGNK